MMQTALKILTLFLMVFFSLVARQAPAEEPWTLLGFASDKWFVGSIAEDPSGTVYADAGFLDAGQFNPSGLFRLYPGETEWTQILDDWSSDFTFGGFIAPASGTILGASRYDLHRSVDSGETWTTILHDEKQMTSLQMLPSGEIVTLCLDHYLISTDLGETWTSHPITATDQAVMIGFDGPDRIYVIDEDYLYRSEDSGASWTVIYQDMSPEAWLGNMTIDSQGNLYVIYSDSFSGASNFLFSSDHGDTWSNLSNFMTRYTIASTDEIFALKSGPSEIYRSTDHGQTWTIDFGDAPYYDEPDFYGIFRLHINPTDTLYVVTSIGLYRYEINVPVELSAFSIK